MSKIKKFNQMNVETFVIGLDVNKNSETPTSRSDFTANLKSTVVMTQQVELLDTIKLPLF